MVDGLAKDKKMIPAKVEADYVLWCFWLCLHQRQLDDMARDSSGQACIASNSVLKGDWFPGNERCHVVERERIVATKNGCSGACTAVAMAWETSLCETVASLRFLPIFIMASI